MPRPIVAPLRLWSSGSSSIFVHSTLSIYFQSLFSYYSCYLPFCRCHNLQTPIRLDGSSLALVFSVRRSVGLAVSWPVSLSLNRVREFVLCLPKGFSIESVKYHNLQSNQKLCISSFSFTLRCCRC